MEIPSRTRGPDELREVIDRLGRHAAELANGLDDLQDHTPVSRLTAALVASGVRGDDAYDIATRTWQGFRDLRNALFTVSARTGEMGKHLEWIKPNVTTWPEGRN